jgi:hypothetical protein
MSEGNPINHLVNADMNADIQFVESFEKSKREGYISYRK